MYNQSNLIGKLELWSWFVINKAEALKVFYEIHDNCKSCLMNCVDPDLPSSQIEETSNGFRIVLNCELDYYAKKCFAPIIEKYNLALAVETDLVIITWKTWCLSCIYLSSSPYTIKHCISLSQTRTNSGNVEKNSAKMLIMKV